MTRTLSKQALALLFMLTVFPTLVHADFYVISAVQKMKNVVTVAKSGGQYSDVKAAIDSIDDAGPDNRYLVYIEPGIYTVTDQIHLKPYVTVIGSGSGETKLQGEISTNAPSTSAVICGEDNATLTQLSVENQGGFTYSIGILNHGDSPVLDDISVTATGGTQNRGVHNYYSSPTMTKVTATAMVGTDNRGVYNFQSSPTMTNVTATAWSGTDNYGVYNNSSSSPTMTNVTAQALLGDNANYGVKNEESSSPTMTCVTATGEGGSYNCGVHNDSSSSPTMLYCTLKGYIGVSYGVVRGTVKLSTVTGGLGGGLSAECISCLDENGNPLDETCN